MKGYEISGDHTKSQQEITRHQLALGVRGSERKGEMGGEVGQSMPIGAGKKSVAWNFISWELYIKLYLFNEVGTGKMYRTCQTPGPDASGGKITSPTLTTHLVFQPASLSGGSLGNNKWEARKEQGAK